jgi:hypothetical protein
LFLEVIGGRISCFFQIAWVPLRRIHLSYLLCSVSEPHQSICSKRTGRLRHRRPIS